MSQFKNLVFVDKNRSKFVHTLSIYAGYTPLGGLFTKIFSLYQKFQNKASFLIFQLQWGPIVIEKLEISFFVVEFLVKI